MAFNINSFRADGPVLGMTRPSNFEVAMYWPSVVTDDNAGSINGNEDGSTLTLTRKATFMIKATQSPASLIDSVDIGYYGRKIKLRGDRTYQDWTVSIYNDEDFRLRNAFIQWHNGINRVIGNTLNPDIARIAPQTGTNFGNSYKTDAVVYQLAQTGGATGIGEVDGDGVLSADKFNGIFPVSVDAMRLDWDASNEYQMFDVTFACDWWEPYRYSDAGPHLADLYGDSSSA